MKKFSKFFIAFTFISLFTATFSFAVVPTYDMRIKNIAVHTDPITGADSILTFDVYIQWTNPGVSDPFELYGCDGAVYVNHQVFNGGVIYGIGNGGRFGKISGTSDLPLGNSISTNTVFFDAFRDLIQWHDPSYPVAQNFIVDSGYPGTRIFTFKLRTNAHSWSPVAPNLKFKLVRPSPTVAGYYQPSTDPENPDDQDPFILNDTIENHFITENDFPLPVELQSFTSFVYRNDVTLKWTTASETNNQRFEIERKIENSDDWILVGFLPGNRTTHIVNYYNFTERLNTGNYNFRLKQIDYNNNYTYYNLINTVNVGVPSSYRLFQNYPNPFNPVTKIDYVIPNDANVKILLYDTEGKEIRILTNESKTSGYYTLQFDASDLHSGIYFYKMIAKGTNQNFVETKKMLLIK